MRKVSLCAAVLGLVALPAMAEDKPKTKGIDKPFTLTLPFSKISTSGDFEVEIIAAPITSVIARGDLPGLDLVNAVVVGDTLQVSQSAPPVGVKIKDVKAKMTIQVAGFSGLESNGAGKVTVKKLRAGDFVLSQRSRNELKFEDAKFNKLDVSVTEGTRVELSGQCDTINADASTGGRIEAGAVRARSKIKAELDGTGELKVKDKPGDVNVVIRNRTDVDFEN